VAESQAGPQLPAAWRIRAFAEIDSTSNEAKRQAAAGAAAGLVVTAGRQTQGRGRRGNAFVSPPGGLYATLLLRPACAADVAARLSFVAALAVADMAHAFAPAAPLALKWPNDVLLAGGKLAGILLESAASGGRVDWLTVGIGVNLETAPLGDSLPAVGLDRATGTPVAAAAALPALLAAFSAWGGRLASEGFDPVRAAWLERAAGIGGPIRVNLPRGTLSGRFVGLDARGALLLEEAPGCIRPVEAGEVHFP